MIDIYINNQLIDISRKELESFSATYKIADIESVVDRGGSFSKTVNALKTKENLIIFGFTDDVNSIQQNTELVARVEEEGVDIMTGIAVVQSTDKAIEFIIYAENSHWQHKLSNSNLSDIDLSEYDHTYNKTNVEASETAGLPYVYDLCDRGDSYFVDQPNAISIYDRMPSLNIKHLFEKCFKNAGFKLVSTFKDTDYFGKKYMPFSNDQLKNSLETRIFNQAKANRDTSDINISGVTPVTVLFNNAVTEGTTIPPVYGFPYSSSFIDESVGHYVAPVDMVTKFRASLKLFWTTTNPVTTAPIFIYIINQKASGAVGYWGGEIIAQRLDYTLTKGNSAWFNIESDFVHIGAGSRTYVRLQTGADIWQNGSSYIQQGSFFYNIIDEQLCEGQTMEFAENMPDMTQIDFISGIKHAFNLYFKTDSVNRIVYVEPRDDIYSDDYDDWTDKMDASKGIKIEDIGLEYNKTLRLGFKTAENDGLLSSINEGTGTPYGAYDFDVSHQGAADGITEMINPVFCTTLMESSSTKGFTIAKIPKIRREKSGASERLLKIGFRIWHYAGLKTLEDQDYFLTTDYDAAEYEHRFTSRSTYPQFYSFDDLEFNNNSAAFNENINSNGLAEKFYKNSLAVINSGKRFTAFFNIDKLTINNLDLCRLIMLRINNEPALFYIDEITEREEGKVTEVSLITWIGKKKIDNVIQADGVGSLLPYIPSERSALGSITTELIDGVYTVRLSTVRGLETVLTATKGEIKAGTTPAVTEISGIIYPAYTLDTDDNTYKQAQTI